MGRRKVGELPSGLLQVERQFVEWRNTRKRGARIPERLWRSAAKMAEKYGLNQTATVLKLEYYSLKRRMDASETSSTAAFVELPLSPTAHASECVVEFEDGAGASLRVHLKGGEVPDLLALGRSFWNAD